MNCRLSPLLLVIICGCSGVGNSPDHDVKKEYYSNGEVKFIKHYHNGILQGPAIWFYPTGKVQETSLFSEGKAEGPAYTFYPSGSLQSYRFYEQGRHSNIGFDYYDNESLIFKNMFYFNDSGLVYYSRSFDDHGNLKSERGKRPW